MQQSFAEIAWNNKKRRTRREVFLKEMEGSIPWKELEKMIKPHAPSEIPREEGGRPAYGVKVMLRIYFCQQWYQLSDEGMEDTLYDSESVRRFCGLRLETEEIPDETSIMRFRHLLEKRRLQEKMFKQVNRILEKKGLLMRQGTIVDATILNAPSSTKNDKKERDPEMSQTKKGNQWYFGMKMHAGLDEKSGIIHTLSHTTARDSDISQLGKLLHGKEAREVVKFWNGNKLHRIQSESVIFITPESKRLVSGGSFGVFY